MKKYICLAGLLLSLTLFFGCKAEPVYSEMILKINDTLYYGTDEVGPMGDSGCVEGEILSSVDNDLIPTENGSSNFGCVGNPYTYDFGDGEIMIALEDNWHFFYAKTQESNSEP